MTSSRADRQTPTTPSPPTTGGGVREGQVGARSERRWSETVPSAARAAATSSVICATAPRRSRSGAPREGARRTRPGPARRRDRRRSRAGTPRAAGASAEAWNVGPAAQGGRRGVDRPVGPLVPAGVDPLAGHGHAVGDGDVGRGEPELGTPSPVTVHDHTPDLMGSAEQPGRARDVAGGQQLTDARRRHRLARTRPAPSARPTTSNPCRAPISVSSATLPARRWPKWKSSPTTTRRASSAPTRTSRTKSSAVSLARASVEGHHQRAVDARGRQELELLLAVGEDRRVPTAAGPPSPDGGRRSRRRSPIDAPRPWRRSSLRQVAMAEVDAVVGTDGDCRASGRCHAVLGAVDNLHGDEVTRARLAPPWSRPPVQPGRVGLTPMVDDHPLPTRTHSATMRSVPVAS